MPNNKRKPSIRMLKAGSDWTVCADDGVTRQLSESMAWEKFLSSRSGNADLIRGDKVVATMKVRT